MVTLENSSSGHGRPLYITSGLTNWTNKSDTKVTLSRDKSQNFISSSSLKEQQDLMAFTSSEVLAATTSGGRSFKQ